MLPLFLLHLLIRVVDLGGVDPDLTFKKNPDLDPANKIKLGLDTYPTFEKKPGSDSISTKYFFFLRHKSTYLIHFWDRSSHGDGSG